ncbi:MAG: Arm DNA-binding domain-containing protein [Methylotenera sp.]|nr:Arm DNA-binding domain-containing protein [Methylotenera sp.]
MALTDAKIKTAKPADKDYKLGDAGGLYLLVTKAGGRLWRLKYRFGGKEKALSFGAYPAIRLLEARAKRDEAKKLLANDIDPSDINKAAMGALIVIAIRMGLASLTKEKNPQRNLLEATKITEKQQLFEKNRMYKIKAASNKQALNKKNGITEMMLACEAGNEVLLRDLIKKDGNVNITDN